MIKKLMALLLVTASFSSAISQMPLLTVAQKQTSEIYLQTLNIEVKVTGNIANTVMMMTFKNKSNRILEGELLFPLPEGVSVSRYALDINGHMREAVPVEKAKATQVFEAIEHRRVDPGLLEKVEGNNFRTRIYPLPANGTRSIIIGYEEELLLNQKQSLRYHLPLDYSAVIEHFSVKATVFNSAAKPVLEEQPDGNFGFEVNGGNYTAEVNKDNFKPRKSLTITLPKPDDISEVQMQKAGDSYYFLVNSFPKTQLAAKQWGNHVGIIWDASLSGLQRDTKKELELLDAIIKQKQNLTIELALLNNRFVKKGTYTISSGRWENLKSTLENMVYDGGTDFSSIRTNLIHADEYLLFSDGMSSFGPADFIMDKPFYCINSNTRADYSTLNWIASATGGHFINLNTADAAEAAKQLKDEPLQLLGIKQNGHVREVYPSIKTPVNGSISIAGIVDTDESEITLQYGFGNKVTLEKTVQLSASKFSTQEVNVSRVWAQKKIAEMEMRYEQNKAVIAVLGRQFGIVTRNTSLIVLETIDDYITYEIDPPAELKAAYDNIMKQRIVQRQQTQQGFINTAIAAINNLTEWWGKKFEPVAPAYPVPDSNPVNTTIAVQNNRAISDSVLFNPSQNANTITGRVTDAMGNPVAAASVVLKGTRTGTSTDNSGFFSLQKQPNAYRLEITAVGLEKKTVNIRNKNSANVSLANSSNNLNDVVVIGYSSQRKREVTSSVSAIQENEIGGNDASVFYEVADATEALEGRVAGVSVANAKSTSGNPIRLRGASSAVGNNSPLYVVDGVPSNSLPAGDDIESVDVLKDVRAVAIYGARANAGAVIITTKNKNRQGGNRADSVVQQHTTPGIKTVQSTSDKAYMKKLDGNLKNAYGQYLLLRTEFLNTPVFYFDVANWFYQRQDSATALQILSNIAELDLENASLMKLLAYKLKETCDYKHELFACGKVLQWRPMEPQSYRDLGLALADNGLYQQAVDTLYAALTQSYAQNIGSTNSGIEEIIATEINQLVSMYRSQLNLDRVEPKLLSDMPIDIRVVLNWNMNDTDIDLWVTDPSGEKCYYSHNQTLQGGRMSRDFTSGYGPEQFLLKKATPGKYKIEVNYFGDRQINPVASTAVMAEIFLHYASGKQERKIITLQMPTARKEGVMVGEFSF